jgi:hypothetical protein
MVINRGLPGTGQDRMSRQGAGGGPGIFPEHCQGTISGNCFLKMYVYGFFVYEKNGPG